MLLLLCNKPVRRTLLVLAKSRSNHGHRTPRRSQAPPGLRAYPPLAKGTSSLLNQNNSIVKKKNKSKSSSITNKWPDTSARGGGQVADQAAPTAPHRQRIPMGYGKCCPWASPGLPAAAGQPPKQSEPLWGATSRPQNRITKLFQPLGQVQLRQLPSSAVMAATLHGSSSVPSCSAH